jgi:hypothetical protein
VRRTPARVAKGWVRKWGLAANRQQAVGDLASATMSLNPLSRRCSVALASAISLPSQHRRRRVTRKKTPPASLVRSSAAEYLTFVAASGAGGVEAVYAEENVWLSQKMMAQLYDVEVPTINYHLKKVFEDSELESEAVVRNFRITATDGKAYDTKHYSLPAIIAVGYKVNSERAVQFRKWATRVVEEFTIKGFAMDDERLKRGGSVLSDRYFEEQLQRVREIRLSERKFRRGHRGPRGRHQDSHGPPHLDRRATRQDPEVRRGGGQELPDRARTRAALVAETNRLGEGTPQVTSRKGKKPR